jgi:hypothetical protein
MTALTERLHEAFVAALGAGVESHSDIRRKPLCLDLRLPLPPRLRVYAYSLVEGGVQRRNEYKVVLRLPGQEYGEYASFDHSGDRLALVVGYRQDLDVFVLWDASLHPRFKWGGNLQVRDTVVHSAAAIGRAEQRRSLSTGNVELVIGCQSSTLIAGIEDRLASTGGERSMIDGAVGLESLRLISRPRGEDA